MYSKFRVGREKIDELTSLSAFCPFVRSFSLWFDDLSMGPEGFEAVLPFFPENSSCGSKWLMHAVTEFVRISCVLTGSVVEDLLLFGTILALKSPKSTCGSEGGGGLGWAVATVPVSMSDRSSPSLSLALLSLSADCDAILMQVEGSLREICALGVRSVRLGTSSVSLEE